MPFGIIPESRSRSSGFPTQMRRLNLTVAGMMAGSLASIFGQQAAAPTISTEPGQIAWDVYRAGMDQQKDLIPSILPLLKHENSGVRLAAIDALMRLDADVPEENLAFLMSGYWLDSALIFLSKDPKKHAGFLMGLLSHEMDGRQWEALNSILLTAPPPGYAARLLRDLTLGFTVCVQYENPCPGKVMVMAAPFGRPSPENPPGFPPVSLYVVRNGARGVPAVLVASCPTSTTFPSQRQLFLPISDDYTVCKDEMNPYSGAGRSRR